ncbi:MAG: undecaprenyl/decaprenyl-phosphate alpha-N-acetylglucosaminyl 1-phosphate transferase [Planctomycetes bacterium]|nr:undecaprenyl/decaprenyl-phosphate alpha-N-acetylglucosaminyl 1-phosphate transferase [Planctomycetota bacterium]
MQELPLVTLLGGAFAGATLVSYVTTPLAARLADRLGAIDAPGGRHVHERPTARLGGVALLAGLLAGALAFGGAFLNVFGPDDLVRTIGRDQVVAFLIPCLLVFIVGLVDDLRGLSPGARVCLEAVAAAFLIQRGYVIDVIANPFGAPIELGLFAFPLTLLWFVGITNAYNLVDGLDGLLATVATSALLGCAAVAVLGDRPGSATLAVALAGGLIGFLRWNWHPARVFLGDAGSLMIGFTIAALSLKVARNPSGTLALHVPLLLSALPIAETLLTLARRYVNGQPYFVGDRSHMHHVLLNRGLSVRQAVLWLSGTSALFAATAVMSRLWRHEAALTAALASAALAAFGLRWLGYVELRVLTDRLRHALTRPRGRELPHLVAMARAGDVIAAARTVPELHAALREALPISGLTYITVEFSPALAAALGEHGHVTEARNQLAELVARRDRPALWLFSCPLPDDHDETTRPGVCYTIPFELGPDLRGVFGFHRFLAGLSAGSGDEAMRRYLAEPLRLALGRCVLAWAEVSA